MPKSIVKKHPPLTETSALKLKNPQEVKQALNQLNRYAQLLDSQYRIPYTRIKFGWDVIIGFVPVAGDFVAFGLAAWLILKARAFGAPKSLMVKMLGNVAVEFVAGSVPVLGDAFDVYWKANVRNIGLLRHFLGRQIQIEPVRESKLPVKIAWYLLMLLGLVLAGLAGLLSYTLIFL